ncbi:MAG: hypothetical protein M0R06_17180, partial [Sphaerochaeta sp.]|nr:hypothetical protein [Sphaerochaeta sp.]
MDTTQITPEQAEALYKEAVAVVAPEHTPAPPPKYFIRTDEDRMMKISIKVMRELKTSADTVVIADVLANFVWNGQEYLPYAEAQALL